MEFGLGNLGAAIEIPKSTRKAADTNHHIPKAGQIIGKGMMPYTWGMLTGVLCLETAAWLNGMCRFGDDILYVYTDGTEPYSFGAIKYIPAPGGIVDRTDCWERAPGTLVTNPLRTLREIIDRGAYLEHICESIDWWITENGNLEALKADLHAHNLLEKFNYYLGLMGTFDYFDNFYG